MLGANARTVYPVNLCPGFTEALIKHLDLVGAQIARHEGKAVGALNRVSRRHRAPGGAAGRWLACEAPEIVTADGLKTSRTSQSLSGPITCGCLPP